MRATATVGGLFAAAVLLAGCATPSGIADDLGTAMASQRDPQVVRDGGPAYLIMVDALVRDAPDDARIHLVAARLYGSYAGGFVDAPERQLRLTQQALDYATRGLCLSLARLCEVHDMRFEAFRETIVEVVDDSDAAATLYRFAAVWAGWIQARSGDYGALADLPKLEAAFERVLALDPQIDHGQAHVYLGVLQAQRPASLGGQPESARAHFEQAIDVSGGRNLMAKTLFAEHYARLVFDRGLHDRLLTEVVEAEPAAGDLTLANVLAQERARRLLANADDYF